MTGLAVWVSVLSLPPCSMVKVLHRNALEASLGLGVPVEPETTTSRAVRTQPVTRSDLLVVTQGRARFARGTISATLLIMANIRNVTANISFEVSSPLKLLPTPTVATKLEVTTSRHSTSTVSMFTRLSLLLSEVQTKLEPVNAMSEGRFRFRFALSTLFVVSLNTLAISR